MRASLMVRAGRRVRPPRPVGSCGDLDALLPQDGTDRLDPITKGAHFVDESADQRRRGSSSLAKKIEACLRISLDSFKSRTLSPEPLDLLQLVTARTGLLLASTWACTTHRAAIQDRPRASAPLPGRQHRQTVFTDRSKAIRTARSRASGGNCLGMISILLTEGSGIKPGTVQGVVVDLDGDGLAGVLDADVDALFGDHDGAAAGNPALDS